MQFRKNNPEIIFENKEELKFDELIATNYIKVFINRHVGSLRQRYVNGRYINLQKGKDLRFIRSVIGTGGAIVNSKNSKNILSKII